MLELELIKRAEVGLIFVDELEQSLAVVFVFESLIVLELLAQSEVVFVLLQEAELASGLSHHSQQCFLTVLRFEQVPGPQVS